MVEEHTAKASSMRTVYVVLNDDIESQFDFRVSISYCCATEAHYQEHFTLTTSRFEKGLPKKLVKVPDDKNDGHVKPHELWHQLYVEPVLDGKTVHKAFKKLPEEKFEKGAYMLSVTDKMKHRGKSHQKKSGTKEASPVRHTVVTFKTSQLCARR